MIQQANEHFAAGDWAAAETGYRSLVEEDPGHAEALFMLAQVRQKQGDLDEPVELLDQAARAEPLNPNIFHARGVLHINRREPEQAEKYFHQALEIDPNHANSRNGLAFLELSSGRFEAAEHSANLALVERPEDPQALTYLGTALLEQDRAEEAIACLQKALSIEPASPTAQGQLGRAFLASGNAGFAMQCFENALQHNPDAADMLEYLGRAQLENGMFDEAAGNLRKAAEAGRANPDLYRALARVEASVGRPVTAEALLRAALEMAPEREDLTVPLAEVLLARGANDEAVKFLEPLVEQGTDNEQAYALLATAHSRAGDADRARAVLEPRIASGAAPVDSHIVYIQVLQAAGEAGEAEAVLEALLQRPRPPLQARFYKARMLYRSQDPAAIEWLQDLAAEQRLARDQQIIINHMLGDCLHQAGRYQEAARAYAAMAHRHAQVLTLEQEPDEDEESPLTAMDAELTAAWPAQSPGDGLADPVFVIAWPGSGQEQVLPALAEHPDVRILDDQGESQAARRALIDRPRGRSALEALDEEQRRARRAAYHEAVAELDTPADTAVTLDAMWLTVESLPTIYRLFPQARVLLILRDPRDMTVSWLQSGYRDLDVMARVYGAQLRALELCRATVPLDYIEVDFDALDADPAGGLQDLVGQLGLDWDAAVLQRFLDTPPPVIAVRGDWRHYRQERPEGAPPPDTVH